MKKYLFEVCLIIIGCLIFFISCDTNDNVAKIENIKIYETCLEGHVYYWSNVYAGKSFAIKLDDNGKPIKCKVKKECE
jgi:hypothetical protein